MKTQEKAKSFHTSKNKASKHEHTHAHMHACMYTHTNTTNIKITGNNNYWSLVSPNISGLNFTIANHRLT